MAVPEQIPVVNYVADGIVKKFDVSFEYDQQVDLHVYVDGAEPTIDKYFFADNAFNFYIAPTNGQGVKIKRITPKERDTDYNLHTNTVRPKALNTDFDRLWYVLQEVFSDVGGLSQAVQDEIIARIQGDEELLNQLTAEISARMLGDEAVTEDLKNYVDNMIALIIGDPSFNGIDADKVNDESGLSQQEINDNFRTRFINVADYGARAEQPNNTVAINNAALDAKRYKSILWFNDYFPCTGTVNIPDEVVLMGAMKEKCGFTSTANPSCNAGGDVVFNNIKVVAKGSLRIAVSVSDKNAPKFFSAVIDGRISCVNNTQEVKRGMAVDCCDIISDFGTDYDGEQQYDVFTSSGYFAPRFTNNYIDVRNVHRLWKITQGSVPVEFMISVKNSRDILISGNTIKGTGGKQLIDAYFGTSVLKLVDNHFELSAEPTLAGTYWTTIIGAKTLANVRDIEDIGDSIIVSGNTGTIPCDLLVISGNYGTTESGYDGARKSVAKVIHNQIKRTTSRTINGFISARFFNDYISYGNTFEIPADPNATIVNASSNENVFIDETDTYIGGCITVSKATANEQSQTFLGKTGGVKVSASVINFDADGAIRCNALDIDLLDVKGIKSKPLAAATRLGRPLHITSSTRVGSLKIRDCDAIPKTGGNILPVFDTVSRAALKVEVDNSWNPRFKGYFTAPPTVGTYAHGDTVKHPTPSNASVTEWTCTAAGSSGTWRASSWTTGNGTTANRPTLTSSDVGVDYFDTTLGKFIKWSGTAWYDQAGVIV